MPAPLILDHLVIVVDDLHTAIADYRHLGFNVQVGGEHADGLSHNALISLRDGSYLELFALKQYSQIVMVRALHRVRLLDWYTRSRSPIARRFIRSVAQGEGLRDYALLANDIHTVVDRARKQDIVFDGPTPGGRARPDGQQLIWELALPEYRNIPFLIKDKTPRELRVPQDETWEHPNGATGVASITIAIENLTATIGQYQSVTGVVAEVGEEKARFRLGNTDIYLVESDARSPVGPHALVLHSEKDARAIDQTLTHGVDLSFVSQE